jgi:hypothetical protein
VQASRIIVAAYSRPDAADTLAARLRHDWPDEPRVEFHVSDAGELSLTDLQRASAVVLLVSESDQRINRK